MVAVRLPRSRKRPGSRSCGFGGTVWHRLAAPASHHDRATSARGLHSASPYELRCRSGTAAHSQAGLQSGREEASLAERSSPKPIKCNVFLPVSMPMVLTATAFVVRDIARAPRVL